MGRRRHGGPARQRSHLTARSSGRLRFAALAVLTLDGVLSAVIGAFFLPLYVGGVPLPVSGLISGLLNLALVWAALQWESSPRLAALPLWAWLITTLGLTLGGPGGDIVLSGSGVMQLAPVIFVVLGGGPPAYFLWRLTSRVPA
ncbi:hypothetical protein D8S82_13440 [Mycobacterium hodleri]|uniref:Facilitated glucose transporter n=1 Tax=Mycolicibacterium hodleri TaxID=49897 RepID=A0A544W1B9_9MYCO|nr:hypothetical protein [Mycolicibacterium hodleri]TQR86049.1 hypothetical protein D8S82_13440 [Mycolicibacterium hodleri]